MPRTEALRLLAGLTGPDDLFVTSIGATLDDWWNLGHPDGTFFTTVLGSVTSTALGLAAALPHRRVVAIESDGSVLMNTGAMCTLGVERPGNLTILVMDNAIYENIGGFATHTARGTDLARMAAGAGCPNAVTAEQPAELGQYLEAMLTDGEVGYLVARIAPGAHAWPDERKKQTDGTEDKYRFLRHVERLEGIRIHGPQARK